jgi:hypothetical protein
MLDDGRYGSVSELAMAEKLDRGYLGRILMLTLLAPDIVEAIMDRRQPAELGVHALRDVFPVEWGEQRATLGMIAPSSSAGLSVCFRPPGDPWRSPTTRSAEGFGAGVEDFWLIFTPTSLR